MYRTGIGYDTHILVENRKLILGGVTIPFEKGLAGHSDADALLHAITDAILGAAGLPDIGNFFPDTDEKYKNANSVFLLKEVMLKINANYEVVNVDSVIICERPKLKDFIPLMKENLIPLLGPNVNIKATTTEKMNAEGEGKCISAQAVCLLKTI